MLIDDIANNEQLLVATMISEDEEEGDIYKNINKIKFNGTKFESAEFIFEENGVVTMHFKASFEFNVSDSEFIQAPTNAEWGDIDT